MLRTVTTRRLATALPRNHLPPSASLILPSVRSLATSLNPHAERPPTFTTPQLPPRVFTEADSTKPLPPTDLPIEDYASPLLHTATFFSRLFRYSVYGSCTIVLLAVGSLVSVHLWVEHVELKGPTAAQRAEDGEEGWAEELEGWSGAYRGGGTDPRLGVLARAAIRGAWISQNWGGGVVASPVSQTQQLASAAKSPFGSAAIGGTLIGTREEREQLALGTEVGDAGWKMAEQYLVYALDRAETKKGISLAGSGVDTGVDRAAVELEQRLAGLRERIGGRYKLEAAREGWERVYYALSAATTRGEVTKDGWEAREKLRATRKLGELSARLAELSKPGSRDWEVENKRAKGWFVGGLVATLARTEGERLAHDTLDTLEPTTSVETTKSVGPWTSFFAFWSHSHPPSKPVARPTSSSSSLDPALTPLFNLLSHQPSPPLSPPASRAILSSLLSLETFLARTRSLSTAQAVQNASLSFGQSLVPQLHPSGPATIGQKLSHQFYLLRLAALETHFSEVTLALRLSGAEPFALSTLQRSLATASTVLDALPLDLVEKDSRSLFVRPVKSLDRDARATGTMAANLLGFVHEYGKRKEKWCGGPELAEVFYAQALSFAKEEGGAGEGKVEEAGLKAARAGLERCVKKKKENLKV